MKRVAVCLSGCGVFDGSEIYETVLTLLALENNGLAYQCVAPNIDQHHVINHYDNSEMSESRNVLVESARLARGEIKDLTDVDVADFDAVVFVGGFGAAKNLSDFAFNGADMKVAAPVLEFAKQAVAAGKAMGFMCIAPTLIPKVFPEGTRLTIGNDPDMITKMEKLGAKHEICAVDEVSVDLENKVVSTPAYMLAGSITEAKSGIDSLVSKIAEMC